MRCVTYYKKAGPLRYEIRIRLLPVSGNIVVIEFEALADKIRQILVRETPSNFHLCKTDVFLKLNITKDQLSQTTLLSPTTVGIWIDVHVAVSSDLFTSDIKEDISSIHTFLNTVFVESEDYRLIHSVEENVLNKTDRRSAIPTVYKLPPNEVLTDVGYIINEDDLISLRYSPSYQTRCIDPVHINFLHNCSKVILSTESFNGDLSNATDSMFVLGQKVDRGEIMTTSDGKKIVMCAEKYFQLLPDSTTQANGDRDQTSTSQKPILTVTVMFLSFAFCRIIVKKGVFTTSVYGLLCMVYFE